MQLNDLVYHSLYAVGIFLVFLLLTRATRKFLTWLGHKFIAKTETILDDKILDVLMVNVRPLMIIVGLFVAIREIRKGLTPDDATVAQLLEYADLQRDEWVLPRHAVQALRGDARIGRLLGRAQR